MDNAKLKKKKDIFFYIYELLNQILVFRMSITFNKLILNASKNIYI